jgi:hypothetical protein
MPTKKPPKGTALTVKMRESQSHYARQLLDAVKALSDILPRPTTTRARGLANNVPVGFLEQCAVFFDDNNELALRMGITSDQIRTTIARTAALEPVVAEIAPLAKTLRSALMTDFANVGTVCLKAYDFVKSNARALGDSGLAEQARRMGAALHAKRKGPRKKSVPKKTTKTTTTTTTLQSEASA